MNIRWHGILRRHGTLAALLVFVAGGALAAVSDIYPAPEAAGADLAAALRVAAASHRRVLVDFGGNWCPDCHVLDSYFHDDVNKPILEANYVLVHVNIGRWDRNDDIAQRCGIPLHRGVPALAVLDAQGKLVYSQKAGEFGNMRSMQSTAVTGFLEHWKPVARDRPARHVTSTATP